MTIWSTPQPLFDKLNWEFRFSVDVCADRDNAKCLMFWTPDVSLDRDWAGRCFLNPPYGRDIGVWLCKALYSSVRGSTVVCLVPTRTNAPWWHDYAMKATEIRFIRKKLAFVSNNGKTGVPFTGHAVLVFDGKRGHEAPVVSSMEQGGGL